VMPLEHCRECPWTFPQWNTENWKIMKFHCNGDLVGGLEHKFYFSIQLGIIILTFIFFRGIETTNQWFITMMWGTKVTYPSVHPSIHDPFLDEMSWIFQHFLGPGRLVLAWYWHCRWGIHWDSGDAKRGRSPLPAVPGSRTGHQVAMPRWIWVNALGVPQKVTGWWFQTWFLFSIIYGKSSFPLTNSYFSRWLNPPTRWSFADTKTRGFMKVLCAMVKAWEMGFGSLIITTWEWGIDAY